MHVRPLTVVALAACSLAPAPHAAPPATQPAAATADNQVPLGDTKFRFTPPPADAWDPVEKTGASGVMAYTAKSHDAIIAVQLLPPDMVIDKDVTAALIKQLKDARQKGKSKFLLEPAAEPDARFALKIRERYEVKEGKNSEQLHLYRYVGPRLAMVTVNSVAGDAETVAKQLKLGEETLLSVTGPAVKRPATGRGAGTRPVY